MEIVKKITQSRSKTSAVRFSESEYLELQKVSEMAGISMSSVMRQGTKLRIDELQREALKKEAERKEFVNEIMSKSCLNKTQKKEIMAAFNTLS